MTVRGTLALVTTSVALALWAWLVERPSVPLLPPVTATTRPLLSAPPQAVHRVEAHEGDTVVVAVRAADGWTDTGGRRWKAEAVDDFLDTVGGLAPVSVIEGNATAQFGLGSGRLRLLGLNGATLLDLELGDSNPAVTGVYARRAGESHVLIIGGLLSWELKKLRGAAPAP